MRDRQSTRRISALTMIASASAACGFGVAVLGADTVEGQPSPLPPEWHGIPLLSLPGL
jgi:hypothetical protein